jgi:hypothetical protein
MEGRPFVGFIEGRDACLMQSQKRRVDTPVERFRTVTRASRDGSLVGVLCDELVRAIDWVKDPEYFMRSSFDGSAASRPPALNALRGHSRCPRAALARPAKALEMALLIQQFR